MIKRNKSYLYKIKEVVFISLLFSFILGCRGTLTTRISDQDHPLNEIIRAIIDISGEARNKSENQREFISQYFGSGKDSDQDPSQAKERFYARFLILGDRRPYDVQIDVYKEKRVGNNKYQLVQREDGLSREVASELKIRLNQGRGTRNIIDDFKPF